MSGKKHSIGYILKALLDLGTNTIKLREFYVLLEQEIQKKNISNYDTGAYAIKVADNLDFGTRKKEKLNSAVYYAFDIYTDEDAIEFYHSFKRILKT